MLPTLFLQKGYGIWVTWQQNKNINYTTYLSVPLVVITYVIRMAAIKAIIAEMALKIAHALVT